MVDHQFADPGLAGLYDLLNSWEPRGDLGFYLPLVMAADSVLDVGCGTGALLHQAREAGHTGRLVGLDPAEGMLEQARTRPDIEWILGDLTTVSWEHDFDLVVMTGHVFQVLLTEDEIRAALVAIRAALTGDGRFAFETRNPLVRAWEHWTPERAIEAVDRDGVGFRMEHRVDTPVIGDTVTFTTTYTSPAWDQPQASTSTLRFVDAPTLASFLADAGLAIEEEFGDWHREPLTDASSEIITIVRRA